MASQQVKTLRNMSLYFGFQESLLTILFEAKETFKSTIWKIFDSVDYFMGYIFCNYCYNWNLFNNKDYKLSNQHKKNFTVFWWDKDIIMIKIWGKYFVCLYIKRYFNICRNIERAEVYDQEKFITKKYCIADFIE